MPRGQTQQVAVRELPENLGKTPPKNWEAKDLWPYLLEMRSKAAKQAKKITKLEEVVSEHTDPGERLVSGLAETGVAVGAGFLNPFLVAMLGPDMAEVKITDDFGIDTEAITAGGLYALGLTLYWQDLFYGKWFFEAGKATVASYAGHIGRKLGAEIALPEATAA